MPARTGAEYLNGLRGPRELWFRGERVRDDTKHPILGRPAPTLYDLQCAPQHRDRLTYPSPATGQPVSRAFNQPRSVDDLVRRWVVFKMR
jgi:4-hydroxyphenylacetate 3-monooxygenase